MPYTVKKVAGFLLVNLVDGNLAVHFSFLFFHWQNSVAPFYSRMDAFAAIAAAPISHPFSAHRESRRRLLSRCLSLGFTILYVNPTSSVEMKEPEIIRYKTLDSGVKVEELVEGQGSETHEGDTVQVNYVCRRSNGYFVHSSVDQFSGESKPVILSLGGNEVIQGLKDVLVGMRVGGKRRALIPPRLGYVNEKLKPMPDEFGPRRSLLSHAKEPLIFEVQLLKVF
ncbi:Peptidyl-prolyl cis-trans isomerase FKBP16-1, chloroplastic [Apostasia shenzhenica]|uniref:peptidylprolyl isomerase n=1 Tax=Apostasia shenzhenica TaxID=1088818 RepID=A0A2I0AJV7_9ASPA|nr:Peptidyl-prolyl cis-trans isomerase FKBP16-1, chloroplastic [Apostasia shenzhenica]